MRRALAALAAAVLLTGCDNPAAPPGDSEVDVDTPQLREMKADAGIEPCEPGSGEQVDDGLPDVTLPCLGGGEDVDVSTLRGPMILNFWGSYCEPCRQEMPALQQFHERYGDEVTVLGIDDTDVQPDAALRMMADTGATYPSLADPDGYLKTDEGVGLSEGNPQFLLLDADGRIAGRAAGGLESLAEVVALVEKHLGVRL